MKKTFSLGFLLLFFVVCLSGCSTIGSRTASLSIIYHGAALLSLLLLVGCLMLVKRKNRWFILLFSSVLVVNIGYSLLSVSPNLSFALWANRLSYLGSVFLPYSMLIIILNVTNTQYKRWISKTLFILALVAFLIAASPGVLGIYYRNVSFAVINGVSTLVKEYGPLHPLYLFYLLGYFSVMVAVIIRAQVKKKIDTTAYAVILAMAVFVNIGVWLIEQLVSIDFEFLSISYIISELFLLGVHLVMTENHQLKEMVKNVELIKKSTLPEGTTYVETNESDIEFFRFSPEKISGFVSGLDTLTPTEKQIYDCYIKRLTTKEILANLNIKENTLKFHNRNIYNKLGVSSRKEIIELSKLIVSVKINLEQSE